MHSTKEGTEHMGRWIPRLNRQHNIRSLAIAAFCVLDCAPAAAGRVSARTHKSRLIGAADRCPLCPERVCRNSEQRQKRDTARHKKCTNCPDDPEALFHDEDAD